MSAQGELLQLGPGEPDEVSPLTDPSLYSTITVYQPPVQESPFEGREINTDMLTKAGKRAYSREVFNMNTDEVDRLFGNTLQENPQLREERIEFFKSKGISEGDYSFFTRSLHMRRQNYHAARASGVTNLEIPIHSNVDAFDLATRINDDAVRVTDKFNKRTVTGTIVGLNDSKAIIRNEKGHELPAMRIQGKLADPKLPAPEKKIIEENELFKNVKLEQEEEVILDKGKERRDRWGRLKKVAAVAAVTIGILGAIGTYAAYQHPIGRAVLNNLGNLLNGDTAANTIINMALNGDQGEVKVDINFAELDLGGVAVAATLTPDENNDGENVFISNIDTEKEVEDIVPTETPVPASPTPTVTEQSPTNTDLPPIASATAEPTLEEPTDEPTEEPTLQSPTETPTEKEPEIVPTTPPDPETQAMLDILEKNRDPNKFSKILIIGDTGSQFGQYVDEMQLNGGGIQSVFKFSTRDYRYYDLRANVGTILQNEGITGGNKPAFVVITLGANDTNWVTVNGSMNQGTDSEFRAYVEESVRGFMVQGIVPILMGIPADTSLGSKWSNGAQLNPIIRGVAQANRIPYLDPPPILGQVDDVIVNAITLRTGQIDRALATPEIVPTTVVSTATIVSPTLDPTVVTTNTTVPSTATVVTATTQAPTQVASATMTPTQTITAITELPTEQPTIMASPTFTPTEEVIVTEEPTSTPDLPEPTLTPEGEPQERTLTMYDTMADNLLPTIDSYREYLLTNKNSQIGPDGKFQNEKEFYDYMKALDLVEASIRDGSINFVLGINDRNNAHDPNQTDRRYIADQQEHLGNLDGLFPIVINRSGTRIFSIGRDTQLPLPYLDNQGNLLLGKVRPVYALGNSFNFPLKGEDYRMGDQVEEGSVFNRFGVIDPWMEMLTGNNPDFNMLMTLGVLEDAATELMPQGITLQFPNRFEFPHGDGSVTVYEPDANGNIHLSAKDFVYLARIRGDSSFNRGQFFLEILSHGDNASTLATLFTSMPKDRINQTMINIFKIGNPEKGEKDERTKKYIQDRRVVFRGGMEAEVWRDIFILALSNQSEDANFGLEIMLAMFGGYFGNNRYVQVAQQAGLLPEFGNTAFIPVPQLPDMSAYRDFFQN